MTVDEQKIALVIGLFGMSRQVNLAHVLKWKIGEIPGGGIVLVGSRMTTGAGTA